MMTRRVEWTSILVLCTCVVLVFGIGAPNLGFYYEDSAFMTAITSATPLTFWKMVVDNSVPGRNLYVVWQGLIYKMVGNPASHLMTLHVIQSLIDSLIVGVFFVVLRRLGASSASSFIGVGLFAFWPIHGETHYWTPGTPYNLSTLFLLLFILTTIRMVQPVRPPRWLWILDGVCFVSALFTYDQLVIFIILLLVLRLSMLIFSSREHALAILAKHAFLLSVSGLYFLLKFRASTGEGPTLTRESWVRFWPNAHQILLQNFGTLWLQWVKPLYARTSASDVGLALLAASVVVATSLVHLKGPSVAPIRSLRLLLGGLFLFVSAYIPVALWYLSPRHNFLPSVGLFACITALMDLLFFRIRVNAAKTVPLVAVGVAVFFFVAAGRGESRCWEQSFVAKRQLYTDLRGAIRGVEILVLQGFPVLLGPAEVILPHDANFGPRLVYKADEIASFRAGDVSSSPAHEGVFLNTLTRFYGEGFSYHAANNVLVVQFVKWLDNGKFSYNILGRNENPTYRVLDSAVNDYRGGFAVDAAVITRQGPDAVLSLSVRSSLPARGHLAMTFSVGGPSGFETWGRRTPDGFLNLSPVLLDSAGSPSVGSRHLDSGRKSRDGIQYKGHLLLYRFPEARKIRIHFLAVTDDGVVGHPGDCDMAFDSSDASGEAPI